MATKGRTPKHPKPHKNIKNEARSNGKSAKRHPQKFSPESRSLVCAKHSQ